MEFLDIGDKIKKIRKDLRLKQEDLSDTNLTRGFVSMIESGRRIPNEVVFDIIIDKFKSRADQLGININIDKEYLSRSAKDDANSYCIDILNNSMSANEIETVIGVAKKYNLEDTLASAYLKLADITYQGKEYIKAFINYMNAFDSYNRIGNEANFPYLYNRMGLCKLNQVQYLEALTCFKFANHYSKLYENIDLGKKSLYNIALCYKKVGNVEQALKYIETHLLICDKDKEFIIYTYSNILKANCYESQGLIDTSIEILEQLISEFEKRDEPLLGFIYSTLGSNYSTIGNFDRSLECFEISEKIRRNSDIPNLSRSIIEKAFVYIKQNVYSEAIALLEEGIRLAAENSDLEYQLKAYYAMADINLKQNQSEEAEKAYIRAINLLSGEKSQDYNGERVWVYSRLSLIYLENNKQDKLKEALNNIKDSTSRNSTII